ncbi:hypothetical protein C8J57DRAFT_1661627 [Mycena rebaudengoi]|nr:hypothetical protein C8J57DRAFT_1661627 [Mycena rebaudengoi]
MQYVAKNNMRTYLDGQVKWFRQFFVGLVDVRWNDYGENYTQGNIGTPLCQMQWTIWHAMARTSIEAPREAATVRFQKTESASEVKTREVSPVLLDIWVTHFLAGPNHFYIGMSVAKYWLSRFEDLVNVQLGAAFKGLLESLKDQKGAPRRLSPLYSSTPLSFKTISQLRTDLNRAKSGAACASIEACKARLATDKKLPSSVDWLTEAIHRFSDASLSSANMKSLNPQTEKIHRQKWSVEFVDAHRPKLRVVRDDIVTRTMPEDYMLQARPGKPAHSRAQRSSAAQPLIQECRRNLIKQRVWGSPTTKGSSSAIHPRRRPTARAARGGESVQKTFSEHPMRRMRHELAEVRGSERAACLRATRYCRRPAKGRLLLDLFPKDVRAFDTPPQASAAPQIRCMACLKNGPLDKVLRCKQCEFRVHVSSCGAVVGPESVDSWICELYQNEESQEASLNSDCLLCPRERKGVVKKIPPGGIAPDSYLHARKPTEGQGWTHVLCSVFIPELTFTDAARLRSVEGLSTITSTSVRCSLCGDAQGAVIRCCDCNKEYHASCAWKHGHKFAEIQPVKSSRRETIITTTFKGESGCMNAIISCKEHDHSKRDIYGICETNEGGETALQVYCQAYKQAPVSQAHGLLRKARRLDPLLLNNVRLETLPHHTDSNLPDPECFRCHTQFSPAFYPVERLGDDAFFRHTCHFLENETLGMLENEALGENHMVVT